jgi:hypothetical protein
MKLKSCCELVEAKTTNEKDARPWMTGTELMEALAREYIVEGLLPYGLSVLVGSPKTGKSFLALDIAAGVASGKPVLGRRGCCVQGGVIMLALDDTEHRLSRRLMPYRERDLSSLYFALEWRRMDDGGLEDLRLALDEHPDTRLLVIDGFPRIITKRRISNAFAALKSLADERNVAVLVVLPILPPNTATVDTLLFLLRGFGREEAVLQVTSRDTRTKELSLKFRPDSPSRMPWTETWIEMMET